MPGVFSLQEMYQHEASLAKRFPNNNNIRAKIRQQLQYLRDESLIEFVDYDGTYRRLDI